MSNNVMTTAQLAKYEKAIKDQLNNDPLADATALKAIVDVIDATAQLERYTQVAIKIKSSANLGAGVHGGVVDGFSGVTGGTGYTGLDGTEVTITGDGTGATATLIVVGDAVTGITILTGGLGYTTQAVDLSGIGGGNASMTVTATAYGAYNENTTLDGMIALI